MSVRNAGILELLGRWVERGWLRALDHAFAVFLCREAPDADALLILAAALASHQLGRGHVCLSLEDALEDATQTLSLPPDDDDGVARPTLPGELLAGLTVARWQAALAHPRLVGHGPGATPLVLAGTRLYLRRYWQYERDVRAAIDARLAATAAVQAELSAASLRRALDALFAVPSGVVVTGADWQKLACALAARSPFSIITGGPGTGKTTTVVKLLALLQSLVLAGDGRERGDRGESIRPLRIRLAAPTGKAAARLNESISGAVSRLPVDALPNGERIRAAIPREVATLHRLLGSRPDSRRFRHDARNPLAVDVLVIDEASMVDLEMMAAVLAALPRAARLVLLGDKDQLASVEAGAVLGELCRRAGEGHYTPATAAWLETVTGECIEAKLVDDNGEALDQSIAMLRVSHRFTADSGIGRLAEAVNAGDVTAMHSVLCGDAADLTRLQLAGIADAALETLVIDGVAVSFAHGGQFGTANGNPAQGHRVDGGKDDETARDEHIRDQHNGGGRSREGRGRAGRPGASPSSSVPLAGYRRYLRTLKHRQPSADAEQGEFDAWAREVLAAHGEFQVLCALRRGPFGVDGLNQRIAQMLRDAELIPASQGWYLGRPVLVTRNDYGLGLMNGDIGITLALPLPPDRAPGAAAAGVAAAGVAAIAGSVTDANPTKWILRVAFPASDGHQGIKWVLPSRLQAVETVFAMTVHKSQGSEFGHVALVLPETLSPILTRELVYTGVTRARRRLTLVTAGSKRVLDEAIGRRVRRASGLLAR